MSYCRWSTDDFRCDVYVYADMAGGYTANVAGRRVVWGNRRPAQIDVSEATPSEIAARHREVMDRLNGLERKPIGLPYDGERFRDPSPWRCAVRLRWLRRKGYNVPKHAIEALIHESEETDA